MKKVFSNSALVCHKFAAQTQTEGRNQTGNIFFEGNTLYSYGYHYFLAEFKETKNGKKYVLINDKGYSVTTNNHIQEAKQATRHYKQFFTTTTDPKLVYAKLTYLYDKYLRAKKPENYLSEALNLYQSYKDYNRFVGFVHNDRVTHKKIQKQIKMFAGNLTEAKKALKEKEKAAAEKRAAAEAKQIEKFYNYKVNWIRLENDILRMSANQQYIETSQQVKISLQEAKRFYNVLLREKNLIGQQIESYTVLKANGVIKIGCHTFVKDYLLTFGQKYLNQ